MAAKYKQYSLYDTPPPRHWYQRKPKLGWFSGAVLSLTFMGFAGFAVLDRIELDDDVLAAETTERASATPKKPDLFSTQAENIVDVQAVLDKWAKDHDGQQWGVVAKSVRGPTFDASINPDLQFKSTSLHKLFSMVPIFQQLSPEKRATTQLSVAGSTKQFAACLSLMIRLSDAACSQAVGEHIDWSKADAQLSQQGYKKSLFIEQDTVETSPANTAALLYALNEGKLAAGDDQTKLLKSMREQYWRAGIPAGCPGCTVANKSAQHDTTTHDVAIVQYRGGTYILAIFSKNGSHSQVAELAGKIHQQIMDVTTSN